VIVSLLPILPRSRRTAASESIIGVWAYIGNENIKYIAESKKLTKAQKRTAAFPQNGVYCLLIYVLNSGQREISHSEL
jgi:hypothetical protein